MTDSDKSTHDPTKIYPEDEAGYREKVYDEEIAPLMTQIIEICKREKLPMMCAFELDLKYENDPLYCTTTLIGNEYTCNGLRLHRAHRAYGDDGHYFATTTIVSKP